MPLLILLLLFFSFIMILYKIAELIYGIYLKLRIAFLLDTISTKRDLLYMKYRDLELVVAEVFKRRNHRVEFSDRFGEGEKGLIIDGTTYVQLKKDSFSSKVNVEQTMKLARSMQRDSIYRGIFITLGDFENSTYKFCHKNVITCINGDGLLKMCLKSQTLKKPLLSIRPTKP